MDILLFCNSQPLRMTPWTAGTNIDRPRQPYMAERSGRYEGFPKPGLIVKTAHPIAVAEAYSQIKRYCQSNRVP